VKAREEHACLQHLQVVEVGGQQEVAGALVQLIDFARVDKAEDFLDDRRAVVLDFDYARALLFRVVGEHLHEVLRLSG
jgi:hypothetical protein